jgi:glycosyltransferase involved in cell wall biosynthesis
MKIAVIGCRGFPGVQGGVEKHCEKLYTHLAEQGCDVTLFTRKPYIDPSVHIYRGVILIPVNCPKNKYFEAFVHTFKSLLEAKKMKPDIIHIHAIGPSFFAPLARMLRMKVVVTNHGPDYRREKWPLLAKLFLKLCEYLGMKAANEVIAIAKNIAVDIETRFGKKTTVIPNGVEIPELTNSTGILERYGLDKRKYVLAVGRFVPEKGFDDLLEAFAGGNSLQWKLVIAGDADHEDDYSLDLKRRAAAQNTILTGFLSGVPLQELYSHAGLFVLPSHYEGLPIVLLEAMSYGLPCLASNIAANINVGLDQKRYFEVGNINLLKSKIKEAISSSWKEEEREAQIKMVAEKYDWRKIAKNTLQCYRAVMGDV